MERKSPEGVLDSGAGEKPSKGTAAAAEIRAQANTLTDAERHDLMGRAMELIYQGEKPHVVGAHSR